MQRRNCSEIGVGSFPPHKKTLKKSRRHKKKLETKKTRSRLALAPLRRRRAHSPFSKLRLDGSSAPRFFLHSTLQSSFSRGKLAIVPEITSHYKFYEDAFVKKVKDELVIVLENPALAGGVALVSGLLLLRGPRRFLFRNTLGRFQNEESRIVKTESILKELGQSMDKLKKESKNTILRAGFGEEELLRGRTKIRNAGSEIQRLSRTIYKTESETAGLMDALREIPGRNALKLRAEVASLASDLKEQRRALDKRIMKIAELGIRV